MLKLCDRTVLMAALAGFLFAGGNCLAEASSLSRAVYDSDPNHLWNRVYGALFVRTGPDGKEYGHDRLEPLLWRESKHLRTGPSVEKAVAVLEEFIRGKGESLVDDRLKRAMLQRDLWQVASWLADQPEDTSKPLTALLARAMQRLALSRDQIAALPDNYALAVASGNFAGNFDPDKSDQAYLPPDLFKRDGPWICVGRTDGRTAPLHLQQANPFANSAFLVFLKLPGGREASLAFLKGLTAQKKPMFLHDGPDVAGRSRTPRLHAELPQLPAGTELALVRRALLVDADSQIVASPLTESVQLRFYRSVPPSIPATPDELRSTRDELAAFDIQLGRRGLFANSAGGLSDMSLSRDFKTGFASHTWDEFEREEAAGGTSRPFLERAQPFLNNRQSCYGCHTSSTIYATMSFQRYSAADEKLTDRSPPLYPVAAMTVSSVESAAIKWKGSQADYIALRKFLGR